MMGERHGIFATCLFFLSILLSRGCVRNRLAIEQVSWAINESRIHVGELQSVNSSTSLSKTNQSFSISLSNRNSSLSSDHLCSRDEIRIGFWKQVILDTPPYLPRTVHLQCYPDSEYNANQWMHTHEWQPNASSSTDCTFTDWDPNEYCKLMRRATILIIGDSLSFEHYRSLGHLLGIHISQFSQHESKKEQKNIVNYACRKQTRIVYRRDDLLSNVSDAIFGGKTFPQVIVMNRGAHYQNDTMLMTGMQKVVKELIDWKLQCEIFNITCHLLWRTSVPGHPNCEKNHFHHPVNDIHAMEALVNDRSNYNNRTIQYHWFDYQHQNELVVDMLTKQEILQQEMSTPFFLEIIDAYYLNMLRPDEHRAHQGDCLHSCYPGKMDVYSQLLLHFLKIQRSQTDIDSMIAWQENRTMLRY
mmetsp:Transcript_20961/g.44237  ORF Transcript_20961/g.44237 Transcript_20961/m.44237 type:complete len:415 (+) Transcript_20961:54-1298(+)